MSGNGRILSKRSGAIKKRETLEDKLRKRQEEPKIRKQKTLAKNREVKLSETAKESDELLSSNSSVNQNALVTKVQEEPVLDDALDISTEANLNLNMVNPEYAAELKEIKKAEFKVNDNIGRFLSYTLTSEDLTDYKDSLK